MFASVFSRGSMKMIEKISLDNQSTKPTVGWVSCDPQLIRAVERSQTVVTGASDAPSAVMVERLIEMTSAGLRVKGNAHFFFRHILDGGRAAR